MGLPSHCCPQYLRGLKSFIDFARANMEARSKTTIYCPCLDCGNDKKYSDFEVVYAHLIVMDLYQITLVGISTERKGLMKGGNPIKKVRTAGKGRTVIRMGKKAMVMMVNLMMRNAFWSTIMTSLMCWSTIWKT